MTVNKTLCRVNPAHGPSKHRDFCGRCYNRLLVLHGRWHLVPSEPVIKHIARLRDLGWTWPEMSQQAGLGEVTVWRVWNKRPQRVRADTARGILALPLVESPSRRGVDSTGSRRRVHALAWMGWTATMVAEATGIAPKAIAGLIGPSRRISRRNAAAIAEVYERWSHLQGPSKLTAGKARARGYAPPAAWDYVDIDDPAAEPDFGAQPEQAGADPDEVRHLLEGGCTEHEAARKLGVKVRTLQGLARRAS